MRKNSLIFFLLISLVLKAQEPERETDFSVEQLLEQQQTQSQSTETEIAIPEFDFYSSKKRNINAEELDWIFESGMLSKFQVQQIQSYKAEHGLFISLYELQSVKSLEIEDIQRLLPYIDVKEPEQFTKELKSLFKSASHRLVIGYQQKKNIQGNDENEKNMGLPFKLFFRYRLQNEQRLSLGILAEKDDGEPIFNKYNKAGFDFYSAHFLYRGKKWLKSLVLGDYEIHAGQGLVIWNGFAAAKGFGGLNLIKTGQLVKPFTSTHESAFFRGAAFHTAFKNFHTLVFVSYFPVDASVFQIDSSEVQVNSIQESGYHRTENELKNKWALNRWINGGSFRYEKSNYKIGVQLVYTHFDKEIKKSGKPEQQFRFSGKNGIQGSVDFKWHTRNVLLFGESGISHNLGFGMLHGLIASVHNHWQLSMIHRYYSPNFQSLYGNAFAENSQISNEHGLYISLQFTKSKKWNSEMYIDACYFPVSRFRINGPSVQSEVGWQCTYTPNKKLLFQLQYQFKKKPLHFSETIGNTDQLAHGIKGQLRVLPDKSWEVCIRAAYTFLMNTVKQHGYMTALDVNWHPLKWPISGSARIALFQTDSYDSRIYSYERNLAYSFSIPAYSGKGMRYFLNFKWRVYRFISLSGRFSHSISLGNMEENSGDDLEWKAQLMFSF